MQKPVLSLIFFTVALSACSDQSKVEDAVALVALTASDPENVIFRDVTKSKLDDDTYCGEFRSKEGLSSWGEFQRFTSDGIDVFVVEELPTTFEGVFARLARGHSQSDIDSMTERDSQSAAAMEQYRLCKHGV